MVCKASRRALREPSYWSRSAIPDSVVRQICSVNSCSRVIPDRLKNQRVYSVTGQPCLLVTHPFLLENHELGVLPSAARLRYRGGHAARLPRH